MRLPSKAIVKGSERVGSISFLLNCKSASSHNNEKSKSFWKNFHSVKAFMEFGTQGRLPQGAVKALPLRVSIHTKLTENSSCKKHAGRIYVYFVYLKHSRISLIARERWRRSCFIYNATTNHC